MEMRLNNHMFDKYQDFDGDEAELAQMLVQRKERRAKIKADLEAAKA